jgi:hypothetical protein
MIILFGKEIISSLIIVSSLILLASCAGPQVNTEKIKVNHSKLFNKNDK